MHCKEARRRGINGSTSYPVSGSVSSPVISFEVEMADNATETVCPKHLFCHVLMSSGNEVSSPVGVCYIEVCVQLCGICPIIFYKIILNSM